MQAQECLPGVGPRAGPSLIEGREPDEALLKVYSDPETEEYNNMVEEIRKELHFTSLRYHRLDDMIEATGLPEDQLCTYCWSGKKGTK